MRLNLIQDFFAKYINDYSIKKKFFLLYILCVLLPLILTDSVVIFTVLKRESEDKKHIMENIANSVQYSFYKSVNRGSEIAKSIYMSKYINDFLNREYINPLDYYNHYQESFKDTMIGNILGIDNTIITIYSDNSSIVNGREFKRLETIKDEDWYKYLQKSGLDKVIYFDYDTSNISSTGAKRKILFIQRLNYYNYDLREKVLKVELDCSSITRNISRMNYDNTVYICSGDYIIISNGKYGSISTRFSQFTEHDQVGFSQNVNLYGMDLDIIVMKPKFEISTELLNNLPIIILLVLINTVLPFLLFSMFNRSFTERIEELTEVFKTVESESLVMIPHVRGKDEIGSLMCNYNIMVKRTNSLIEKVYKNQIYEHEMTVARQNAELLALHSQINPHFLFNALESIRMHSIIKRELETADMVEKLSIMQRQYVDWGDDLIDVLKEIDFVYAYLGLQKYRFGDRLSYEIHVDDDCTKFRIPKLSIVTFVENACVHGIESKITPGWIFVRIYKEDDMLCLEIEDTGIGISEDLMVKLEYKMKNANISMLKERSRVGIVNACLRLNMISNKEVEYELDGDEGSGLIVQIKIPINYVL
ncbi:MAG: histidine kinase [Spirochaetales bacterium]|nr:histidine kinase [Spirochaetales bacterium]